MSENLHMVVVLLVMGTAFLLMASNADKVAALAKTGTSTAGDITTIFTRFGTTKAAA